MPQVTARNVSEVRCWIETTPHNFASKEQEKGFFILRGRFGHKLRVPLAIWEKCFVYSGSNLDARMFRWNHYKEFEYLFQQRQQEKMPKTPG